MFTSLRIQNFKGWRDTRDIQMKPLTLFFGTNSSGKSSIGQFLMMLKQTVESSDRRAVFFPGGKNSAVQLGSFKDMVFERDTQNSIEFSYTWDLVKGETIEDPSNKKKQYKGNSITFTASIRWMKDNGDNTLAVNNLSYNLLQKQKGSNAVKALSIGMKRLKEKEYSVQAEIYDLKRISARPWNPKTVVRFYGFPEEVLAYYQNAGFVQNLNLCHENLFHRISYLGPMRIKPERTYYWVGNEPESVGYSGENTIAAILAAKNRSINLGYKRTRKEIRIIIAEELMKMGLIEAFEVEPISESRQEYEVKLKTKGLKEFVNLPDVGFGISQVLPVITQLFYTPANSIIIMEQPEIHLHPSAQAALADVMIDAINSKENFVNRNIQLIIETHSEHFLRRLQRRIAESDDLKDKVSAYFADVSKSPAQLEPLPIDLFGRISNWPENFFGNEMDDIIAQDKATLKRLKNLSCPVGTED